jgi:hypothetical protein
VIGAVIAGAMYVSRRRRGEPTVGTLRVSVIIWAILLVTAWAFTLLPRVADAIALVVLPAAFGVIELLRRREIRQQTGRSDDARLLIGIAGIALSTVLFLGIAWSSVK